MQLHHALLTSAIALTLVAACSSSDDSPPNNVKQNESKADTGTSAAATTACTAPVEATATGCKPNTPTACAVSNDAPPVCRNVCDEGSYGLGCTGADLMGSNIPEPPDALGCSAIGGPTPSNYIGYCCPCR